MSETSSLTRTPFPLPSLADWRAVVERDLKGAPYAKKLLRQTPEGLSLDCLYTAEGPAGGGEAAAPTASGLGRPAGTPWRVVARASGTPAAVNAQLKDELSRGADSIRIRVGGALQSAQDLDAACAGIALSAFHLVLEGPGEPVALAALAAAFAELRPDWSEGGLALDPCRAAAAGELQAPLAASLERLGPALDLLGGAQRSLEVSTAPFHGAGASEAEDLGFAVASALELIRNSGLSPQGARDLLRFSIPLGSELFMGIAKLRALRALWARVEEVLGLTPAPISIHVESAWRELGARDPWVNVLRGTATAFAAAVGGASSIALAPWDACLGSATEGARRVARNTHTILREESHLHRVADPGAGSYYLEELTSGLAREAWGVLQAVEAEGGLAAALSTGWVAARLKARASQRAQAVAKRRFALTGVSDFPLLSEEPPPEVPPQPLAALGDTPSPEPEALRAAAGQGLGLTILARALGGEPSPGLAQVRLAEPFEALRSASDAELANTGQRPRAFLLGLGALASHTGRSTWIRNLLAAGGVEGVGAEHAEPEDVGAAFRESGARFAVICGRDADYPERLSELCAALGGAERILLAGRPGERESAYREAGVSDFLYLGCDVVSALERLLSSSTPSGGAQ